MSLRLPNRFHQLARFHIQRACQLHDIEQPDVSFTALHTANAIPVQLRQLSQLFLRQVAFLSQ
jgi:hypothetical protein